MDTSALSNVYIAAAAAIIFYIIAIVMAMMTSRQISTSDAQKPSLMQCLLRGESLTPKGMNYRIFVFIALMFAIMNTLATAFIFIASQTQA